MADLCNCIRINLDKFVKVYISLISYANISFSVFVRNDMLCIFFLLYMLYNHACFCGLWIV